MDDNNEVLNPDIEARETLTSPRDENRSPTSGSSSEPIADGTRESERNRKRRRNPKAKRKRKWKPYSQLTWDEKKLRDDRESKRAFAKRERLSMEGHPIAPYNTTQFLMEDRKGSSPASNKSTHQIDDEPTSTGGSGRLSLSNSCKSLQGLDSVEESFNTAAVVNKNIEQKRMFYFADSPHNPSDASASEDVRQQPEESEAIQRYILKDFSHTYAGLHAEELQSRTKAALIEECLRLEKKIESLERRVKESRKRQKDESRNYLLEKINQLQALNAELVKENASLQQTHEDDSVSLVLNGGAETEPTDIG